MKIRCFAFVCLCVCAAFGWAIAYPYHKTKRDEPIAVASREELSRIMDAVNNFSRAHPDGRYPTNLSEVGVLHAFGTSNLHSFVGKFIYLAPSPDCSRDDLIGRVIVVEKLGHYKYRFGGYCGFAGDSLAGWYTTKEYELLAEKNGVSIERFR